MFNVLKATVLENGSYAKTFEVGKNGVESIEGYGENQIVIIVNYAESRTTYMQPFIISYDTETLAKQRARLRNSED